MRAMGLGFEETQQAAQAKRTSKETPLWVLLTCAARGLLKSHFSAATWGFPSPAPQ